MAVFDVAVGLSDTEINSLLDQFFTTVPDAKSPFQGSEKKTLPVIGEVTLTWKIPQVPTIGLGPPSQSVWDAALNPKGETNRAAGTPLPTGDMLSVTVPLLDASFTAGKAAPVGGSAKNVTVYATVAVTGSDISFTLVAVFLDESGFSKWDKAIFNDLLLPQIFKSAQAMIQVVHVPQLTWQGVTLETPVFQMSATQLVMAAVLKGSANPVDIAGVTWPTEDVFVLASEALMNAALAAGLAELIADANADKTKYGLQGSGEFKKLADYDYDSTLSAATATVATLNPLTINATVTLGSVDIGGHLTPLGYGLAAIGCGAGAAIAAAGVAAGS